MRIERETFKCSHLVCPETVPKQMRTAPVEVALCHRPFLGANHRKVSLDRGDHCQFVCLVTNEGIQSILRTQGNKHRIKWRTNKANSLVQKHSNEDDAYTAALSTNLGTGAIGKHLIGPLIN